ncbi:MAG: hypothetical protein N2504_06395 [candidate division WOR-3 bacterium]|nr:hypothetical protein [candidate division WOR-3 bacterium]MCX7948198.1 hypothetical protein [candidate division WOR-3 bacterium]MDW8151105.1 hypothetical protein [candidate division WOR-3 bacterium]
MDIVLALIFSYFYSVFYYTMPINLIPIFILSFIRNYGVKTALFFSLILGIITDAIYPSKIWISPVFYVSLCYILNFLKEEFILIIIVFTFWLLVFEFFRYYLDFKTSLNIVLLRIFLTIGIFSFLLRYSKTH